MNTYDRQILEILAKVGERGIGVQALAKHVYNMNRTFFLQPEWNDVYQYVQQYLRKNSSSAQSLIEHTERRGYYRLNTLHSSDARQLALDFAGYDDDEAPDAGKPQQDLSLSLFDDM